MAASPVRIDTSGCSLGYGAPNMRLDTKVGEPFLVTGSASRVHPAQGTHVGAIRQPCLAWWYETDGARRGPWSVLVIVVGGVVLVAHGRLLSRRTHYERSVRAARDTAGADLGAA